MITLQQILELVGPLDDAPGGNAPRERFRKYLAEYVLEVGAVRDYIETCLRTSGSQYNRALQDLVNHTGRLIGFNVQFGRYQGVQGEVGFDGIWHAANLSIVVEVKTSDVYAIKTATLIGYIDHLISDKRVPDWDHALGLYVFGRLDAEIKQLEHAIVAEKRAHQLRVATVESILSIAELVQEGNMSQEEALVLLRPTGVSVDDIVRLIARIASKSLIGEESEPTPAPPLAASTPVDDGTKSATATGHLHILTPVADDEEATAEETIRTLLGSGWYVFGEKTPGRKSLKPGDRICFYRSGVGVVAEARVSSSPERKPARGVRHAERYPWRFKVDHQRYFFDKPIVIDATLRSRLEAFKERDPASSWAWFVQGTHQVTEHDFQLLTGRAESSQP